MDTNPSSDQTKTTDTPSQETKPTVEHPADSQVSEKPVDISATTPVTSETVTPGEQTTTAPAPTEAPKKGKSKRTLVMVLLVIIPLALS